MSATSHFFGNLGAGDTPLDERLYLLIPIDGCAGGNPEKGKPLNLVPEPLDFFCEDSGFEPGDQEVISRLLLGESVCIFDGIAQEQTIVRVA